MNIGMFLDIMYKATVKNSQTRYFYEYSFFPPYFLNKHLQEELLGHRINEYFSHIFYEKHYVKVTETL